MLIPVHDQRTEQLFIDTRNALCQIPAFRDDIIYIRRHLPSLDSTAVESIATVICRSWKILNGEAWVILLLRHWDPAAAKYPPSVPPNPSEGFSPWTIELNYLQDMNTGQDVCRRAIITLNAGVSGREALRVAALAQQQLDRSTRRKGRPGVTDIERDILRSMFVKLGPPKPSKRTATILKVQKDCTQLDHPRQFSKSVIGQELRQWLIEKEQRVRRYTTELSGQSSEPS